MKKLLLASVCALPLLSGAAHASEKNLSVQFMFDNGAGMQTPGKGEIARRSVLGELNRLERKPEYRQADINILNTASLDTVPGTVWSGNPRAVRQKFQDIETAVAHLPNGCSDLVFGLKEIATNISLTSASEIWVVIMSNLIHVGRPCGEKAITLPQDVPANAGPTIAAILADERVTKFIVLLSDRQQKPIWASALDLAGAGIRARNGSLQFAVKNLDETVSLVADGRRFLDD